jgi:hypothetical protein
MGTGGRRRGAGRPRERGLCEQSFAFDIRKLAQRGQLRPGASFPWRWYEGATRVGSINVQVQDGAVIASYALSSDHGISRRVDCTLEIDRCAGGFGSRRMFRCPKCGKRCAVVYCGGGTFACRKCLGLGYASEAENVIGRIWRKQKKIEQRLAGGAGEWDGEKPRGMHQSTFDRLVEALDQIEYEKSQAFDLNCMSFLKEIGYGPPGD